ncbi:hypothetical protein [Nocardioides luteus]|nr:hypothetical protein [Nocardioides luteus]
MFTWILIIGGVLLLLGLAWATFGKGSRGIDDENIRNIKRDNVARGDYFGGGGGF